jgi:hypothetical protein
MVHMRYTFGRKTILVDNEWSWLGALKSRVCVAPAIVGGWGAWNGWYGATGAAGFEARSFAGLPIVEIAYACSLDRRVRQSGIEPWALTAAS